MLEFLFNDRYSLVVGEKSKWARRRSVELADLVDEPWIMTPLDALGDSFVTKAFRVRGLRAPTFVITTFSIHLRNNLVGSGKFITALPALGAATLPQTPFAQRAADRIVCSSPRGGCDA